MRDTWRTTSADTWVSGWTISCSSTEAQETIEALRFEALEVLFYSGIRVVEDSWSRIQHPQAKKP